MRLNRWMMEVAYITLAPISMGAESMPPILYDLGEIAKNLDAEHRIVRGAIRQLFGAYAIQNDLREASNNLGLFWDWHMQNVVPARSIYGDDSANAAIGKALFSLTAIQLTRALDMGADGRARIDMRPSIRAVGLEGALDELLEFRNQEMAHYGGFTNNRGRWSNDRAVMFVDGKLTSTINVWTRWNSQRTLGLKMSSLLSISIETIESYILKKENIILSEIQNNQSIRKIIKNFMPSNLFDPEAFFNFVVPPMLPTGPLYEIEWEQAAPT